MRKKHYKKKIIFAFFFKSFLQEIRALISENKSQSQGILIEKLSCLIREWWYFFNFCPFSNCFVPDTFLPLSFPSASSAPFLKWNSSFSGFSFSYFFRHEVHLKQFCCFFKTTFLRLFFSLFLDPQNDGEPKSLDSLYFLRYPRSGGSKVQKEELSIGLKKGLLCKKKNSTALKKNSTALKKNIAFKKRGVGASSSKTKFFLKSLFFRPLVFRRLFLKRVRSSFNEEAIIKVHNELKRKRVGLPPRIGRSYRSELTPPTTKGKFSHARLWATKKSYHITLSKGLTYHRGVTFRAFPVRLGRNPYFFSKFKASQTLNVRFSFLLFFSFLSINPFLFSLPNCFLANLRKNEILTISKKRYLTFFELERSIPILMSLVGSSSSFDLSLARVKKDRNNVFLYPIIRNYLVPSKEEKKVVTVGSLFSFFTREEEARGNPNTKKPTNIFLGVLHEKVLRISKSSDSLILKLLWKWTYKRHSKKSNKWLIKQYFPKINGQNRIFANKEHFKLSNNKKKFVTGLASIRSFSLLGGNKREKGKYFFPFSSFGCSPPFPCFPPIPKGDEEKGEATTCFPPLGEAKEGEARGGGYFFPKGYSFPFGYCVEQEKSASTLGTLLKNLYILPFRSKNGVKAKSFLQTSCFSGRATVFSKLLNPSPLSRCPPLAFASSPSPFLLLAVPQRGRQPSLATQLFAFPLIPLLATHGRGKQGEGEGKGGEQQLRGEKTEAIKRGREKKSLSYKRVFTLDLFERNQEYNFKRCLLKNILGKTERSRIYFPRKNPLIFPLRTTDKNYTSLSFLNNKVRKGVRETKKNPYSVLTFDSSICRTPYLFPKKVIKKEKEEPQIVLNTVRKETEKPSFQYFINPKPLILTNTPSKLRKTTMTKIQNERSSLQFNLLFSVPTFREISMTQEKKKIKKNSPRKICDQINDLLYWSYRKSHYFRNS